MIHDPFGGRMPSSSTQAPYSNALEVTPDDDRDLPVIPSAIFIPRMIWAKGTTPEGEPLRDNSGLIVDAIEGDDQLHLNVFPWGGHNLGSASNEVTILTQNGERLTISTPGQSDNSQQPLILPVRPRRILRTGTRFQRLTLLW